MTEIIGGRYKIIKHLGRGGFGQTFLAEDLHLPDKPQCVVKLLKPSTKYGSQYIPWRKDDPNFQVAQRLFNTEAQMLYKLGKHDQIPKLLAHFEENQEFYLVQQFIEGKNLTEELFGKPWKETQVINFLVDILTPLAFVHQHKVIHRDLKPDNLIRHKQDNKIVLIDFGAVKEVISQTTSAQGQSATTVIIGTQGYMPSEQSKGKPTLSSDIYAVGMITIEMLTGLHPAAFPRNSKGQITWHDLVQVSPKLSGIIDKMVCEDFSQRYPSAVETLEVVQSLQNQQPPSIYNLAPIINILSNLKKKKIVLAIFTLTVLIIIGLLGIEIGLQLFQDTTPKTEQEIPAF